MAHITPAYGRDYKSKKDFLADLNNGKDFLVSDFLSEGYATISEIPEGSYQIRWDRLRKTTMVKIKGGVAK